MQDQDHQLLNDATTGEDTGDVCAAPEHRPSEGALVKSWECDPDQYDFWITLLLELAPPGIPIHTDQYVYVDDGVEMQIADQRLTSDESVPRIFTSTGGYTEALPLPYKYTMESRIMTRVQD